MTAKEKAKAIVNKITSHASWDDWNGVPRSYIERVISDGLDEYAGELVQNRLNIKIKHKMSEENVTPLTFGQKAVGLDFNPGGSDLVAQIKLNFSITIDHLNLCRAQTDNSEKKRMYSVAITDAQTSCKWAVDAASWNY